MLYRPLPTSATSQTADRGAAHGKLMPESALSWRPIYPGPHYCPHRPSGRQITGASIPYVYAAIARYADKDARARIIAKRQPLLAGNGGKRRGIAG